MKFIDQTKFGKEGNCMGACIASLLNVSIENVPNLHGHDDWRDELNKWLIANHGLHFVTYQLHTGDKRIFDSLCGTAVIGSGMSERGLKHSTLWSDGKMIHDPHPDKTGINELEEVDFIMKYFSQG